MKSGEYTLAQAGFKDLVALAPENINYHWDLITTASNTQDWETLRASSKVIGFT